MTRMTSQRGRGSSRSHHVAAMVALTALYACGDETSLGQGGEGEGATGTPTGGSGDGAGTSAGGAPGNSSTSIMVGDGGSGGDGPAFVCDPAAEPGSLYELYAEDLFEVDPVSMCKFRGDVLLIVNTAAK